MIEPLLPAVARMLSDALASQIIDEAFEVLAKTGRSSGKTAKPPLCSATTVPPRDRPAGSPAARPCRIVSGRAPRRSGCFVRETALVDRWRRRGSLRPGVGRASGSSIIERRPSVRPHGGCDRLRPPGRSARPLPLPEHRAPSAAHVPEHVADAYRLSSRSAGARSRRDRCISG